MWGVWWLRNCNLAYLYTIYWYGYIVYKSADQCYSLHASPFFIWLSAAIRKYRTLLVACFVLSPNVPYYTNTETTGTIGRKIQITAPSTFYSNKDYPNLVDVLIASLFRNPLYNDFCSASLELESIMHELPTGIYSSPHCRLWSYLFYKFVLSKLRFNLFFF